MIRVERAEGPFHQVGPLFVSGRLDLHNCVVGGAFLFPLLLTVIELLVCCMSQAQSVQVSLITDYSMLLR